MENRAGKGRRGKLALVGGTESGKNKGPIVLQHKLPRDRQPWWVVGVGPWRACGACGASPTLTVDGIMRHFVTCERLQLVCAQALFGVPPDCDCINIVPLDTLEPGEIEIEIGVTTSCGCIAEGESAATLADVAAADARRQRWSTDASNAVCKHCGAALHYIELDTGEVCRFPTRSEVLGELADAYIAAVARERQKASPAEGGTAGRAPSAELPHGSEAPEPAPATLRSHEPPSPNPAPLDADPAASTANAAAGAKRRRTADRSTTSQLGQAIGAFLLAEEAKRRGRALQSCTGDVLHIEHPDDGSRALCRPMAMQATCDVHDARAEWCGNCCRIALAWINRAAVVAAIMFWTITPAQWQRGAAYHRWLDAVLAGGAS